MELKRYIMTCAMAADAGSMGEKEGRKRRGDSVRRRDLPP